MDTTLKPQEVVESVARLRERIARIRAELDEINGILATLVGDAPHVAPKVPDPSSSDAADGGQLTPNRDNPLEGIALVDRAARLIAADALDHLFGSTDLEPVGPEELQRMMLLNAAYGRKTIS